MSREEGGNREGKTGGKKEVSEGSNSKEERKFRERKKGGKQEG